MMTRVRQGLDILGMVALICALILDLLILLALSLTPVFASVGYLEDEWVFIVIVTNLFALIYVAWGWSKHGDGVSPFEDAWYDDQVRKEDDDS